MLYPVESKKIIDAFYEVCRHLSIGYSEKVYEKAFVYELHRFGMKVEEQKPLRVIYKNVLNVGDFVADVVVEDKIIIELKAVSEITDAHIAQLINYLATTGMIVGYVLNFGGSRKFARKLGPAALEHRQ